MFRRLLFAKPPIFHGSRRTNAYNYGNGSVITFPARMVVPRAHVYAMGGGMFAFLYIMCYSMTYVIKQYRDKLDHKQ